jgi:hypothetical protein
MGLLSRENIIPATALSAALALTAACGSSSTGEVRPSPSHTPAVIASPNFVPRFQILGAAFLALFNRAPAVDRSTPFESQGRITTAEVDVHVGSQVLKITVNQLPATSVDPTKISSIDILRYDPRHPLTGFDMTINRDKGGTLDASCASYVKPQGLSEQGQDAIFDHAGNPLPGSDAALADALLSDLLVGASNQLGLAGYDQQHPAAAQPLTGNPCAINLG